MQREDAERLMLRVGWLSRQPPEFQARVMAAAEMELFPASTDVTHSAIRRAIFGAWSTGSYRC